MVLGGGAVSYERGTPVGVCRVHTLLRRLERPQAFNTSERGLCKLMMNVGKMLLQQRGLYALINYEQFTIWGVASILGNTLEEDVVVKRHDTM